MVRGAMHGTDHGKRPFQIAQRPDKNTRESILLLTDNGVIRVIAV
jgi:hypothetical protein